MSMTTNKQAVDKPALNPGLYAILFRNNWDGEGDTYETLATLGKDLVWYDYENGAELLEFQGDEVLKAWPLDDGGNVLALLDELEAKDKQIAELEAREVELPPLVDCSNVPFAAYSWNAYRAEAVKALRSAGITVKGDSE